jgi:hypothetical protein
MPLLDRIKNDRDMLDHILQLNLSQAGAAIKKSRQAVNRALSDERLAEKPFYFKPHQIPALYQYAIRLGRYVSTDDLIAYIKVNHGEHPANLVAKQINPLITSAAPVVKSEENVKEVYLTVPHYAQTRIMDRNVARLLMETAALYGPKATVFLESPMEAELFHKDMLRANMDATGITFRTGDKISCIPPLAITNPDDEAKVYMVVEGGTLRPADYTRGVYTAALLRDFTV